MTNRSAASEKTHNRGTQGTQDTQDTQDTLKALHPTQKWPVFVKDRGAVVEDPQVSRISPTSPKFKTSPFSYSPGKQRICGHKKSEI